MTRSKALSFLIALSIGLCPLADAAGRAKKRKMSLAELAALEWKLDRAATALADDPKEAARLGAVASLKVVADSRVVAPLARSLREDPSSKVRKAALEALVRYRTPEIKGLLVLVGAADPDRALRELAQKELKRFPRRLAPARLAITARPFKGPAKADAAALDRILTLPSGEARLWALGKLQAAGHPKFKERLLSTLENDPSPRLRIRAVQLLARAGKAPMASWVAALRDGDPQVRFEVAVVVAGFDNAAALSALTSLVDRERQPSMRRKITSLLEPSTKAGQRLLRQRIRALRSSAPAQRLAALTALATFSHWRAMLPMSCTLLRDKEPKVRAKAAAILTHMHDVSVLTALRTAAIMERDSGLKARVRKALVGLRKRVDKLVKQLRSKEPNIRLRAIRLLGQGAYGPGLAPLIAVAHGDDGPMRRAAVEALLNYHEPKARKALGACKAKGDPKVAKLLARYKKGEAALSGWQRIYLNKDQMIAKTLHKSPIWREDAAIAIGVAGAEQAAFRLIHLLKKDPVESVRLAAAWALVLMGSDAADEALKVAAAKDPSERVRLTARRYLVIDKVSQGDLQSQLMDPSAQARADAAEALSLKVSGQARYDLVNAAMCDPDARVRRAALRGLGRVGGKLGRSVLRTTMRRDRDATVRRAALVLYILAGGK